MSYWGRRKGFKAWFVEPYKQIKLGIIMIILNLTFSFLILAVFGYYVSDMFIAVSSYFMLVGEAQYITWTKMSVPIIIGLILIIIFIILTFLVAVKYTYQIYGPLVSIHRFLDTLLANEIPDTLSLRENDQLKELAAKLNKLGEIIIVDKKASSFIKIYQFIDDLLEGKSGSRLNLRSTDYFNQLCEKLNLLADKIEALQKHDNITEPNLSNH